MKFLWTMPKFVHSLILLLTGFRIVKKIPDNHPNIVHYEWTKEYPMPPHPFNRRFPHTKQFKGEEAIPYNGKEFISITADEEEE